MILKHIRPFLLCRFGELIQLKTGPIRQYWVTNVEGDLASELLNTLECSGRSQLKEPAFGDEFLFLTRSVPKARVSQQ